MTEIEAFLSVWPVGAAALAYVLCRLAARRGWLPNAVTHRSAHVVPTSRAGGVVLLAVFVLGICVLTASAGAVAFAPAGVAVAASLLGLADDIRELDARAKLLGMIMLSAAGAALIGPMPSPPGLALPLWLGYPLAAFWLLGFLNVFNFLDGLNGMAAGTGGVLLALLMLGAGLATPLGLVSLALLAPLLGFGLSNVTRGAPFLGDAGSLLVGGLIAAGALAGGQAMPILFWAVVAGSVPYLADAALTLTARARRGASLMEAHSEHAYQDLARQGCSHAVIASAYAALAALAGGATLLLGAASVWLTAPAAFALWLLTVRVLRTQAARSAEARARASKA